MAERIASTHRLMRGYHRLAKRECKSRADPKPSNMFRFWKANISRRI
jgi:hypothetical protein